MAKHYTKDYVRLALKNDSRTIMDDQLLLAWVWANQDCEDFSSEEFQKTYMKYFGFLIKHLHPETIIRDGRKILADDSLLKNMGKSSDLLRKSLQGQTLLFDNII